MALVYDAESRAIQLFYKYLSDRTRDTKRQTE